MSFKNQVEVWERKVIANYDRWELEEQYTRQRVFMYSRRRRIECCAIACVLIEEMNEGVHLATTDDRGKHIFAWTFSTILDRPILLYYELERKQ